MHLKSFRESQPEDGLITVALDEVEEKGEEEEAILCGFCQSAITDTTNQIAMNGAHSHIFANPHGYVFEIGCYKRATGCLTSLESSPEFSWFSGYLWKIALCRNCSNHLGWYFFSNTSSFFGLIQENLILP